MIMMEDELIRFCRNLIQVESISGKEEGVAVLLSQMMMKLGFDEVRTDHLGNVIGKIAGNGSGPILLFDGHLDCIPVNDACEWTYAPFGGDIASGRIYGRGASDMKGALASMVFGIAQIKLAGIVPDGDIYVSGTVYKELVEGVALKEVVDTVHPDLVIIGQSTGLNLNIGQRGRAEIRVTSPRMTVQSTQINQEKNAIRSMLPFMNQLDHLVPEEHIILGQGNSEITDISSTSLPGTRSTPIRCIATIERRLLNDSTPSVIVSEYQQLSDEVQVEITEQTLVCYTGAEISSPSFYPGWLMEVDHPYVQQALRALHHTGIPAKISSYQSCTSGSYSAGVAKIPTIGFGPSEENLAHVVNEFIEIEQLIKAAEGYYAIAKTFANSSRSELE